MDQKKAIISLNSANYSGTIIAKLLRIPISTVYLILKWNRDEGAVKENSKSGWPWGQQTSKVIKTVLKKMAETQTNR